MWWDGYTQQPVVLLDDIRPATMSFNELLRIADHVPYQARTHDGYVPMNSGTIVITSIFPPQDYVAADEPGAQLFRRITIHARIQTFTATYYEMNNEGVETVVTPATINDGDDADTDDTASGEFSE